ncbi:unnamed protein product [Coffea canephora]|uniref:3-beta hydroxysteroid dehydrogenase/isomerase domain-containing protein n=1 Tax=Coffea canephora TaxID=49390 RepID=A0A068URU6_COFCA|nr:unnamed protein product [Coffea canephora]
MMHLTENEGIEQKRFVVTGGAGFVGSALCLELVRRRVLSIKAFDLNIHPSFSDRLDLDFQLNGGGGNWWMFYCCRRKKWRFGEDDKF